ncbi:MAG: restriction endonuclease [Dehalococcoidales bacterium]|nr:restriction endonuclease [Dehalococcoidales bacterium]
MDKNIIYCGDNLEVLPKYIPDDSVDLIYIDPPFNTSRQYEVFWGEAQERRSFEDRFGDAMTYLEWMRPRIKELYRVLNSSGSFYYHCDWHASHYIKLELDRIFGFDNFRNEIVWRRSQTRSSISKIFKRSHDIILFYTKSPKYKFTMQYKGLSEASKKLYERFDDKGHYQLVPLIVSGTRKGETGKEWRGIDPNKCGKSGSHWLTKPSNLEEYDKKGVIVWPKKKDGLPRLKYYLSDNKGVPLTDSWDDIDLIQSSSDESLGYPTQKPLALLERIIKASSKENDIVLDAFCGCGTTLEAAAKYKRRWIGIDFSPTACRVMAERLEKRLGLKEETDFILKDMPKTVEQLHRMPHFEFQNWAVVALGGIPNKVKVGDYGIDGRLYLADVVKEHKGDFFETLDKWYPIQVKQVNKVGRPDIDKFQTTMRRDKRTKGYFVAFGYSQDSIKEIKRAQTVEGLDIVPITVDELLNFEKSVLP